MKTIRLSDHGILPDTDVTLALRKLFLEYSTDTTFVFEDADYYFSPFEEMRFDYKLSNTDPRDYRVLGIWMQNMERCVLQGNGARLWYEGQMQPITLDHCNDIKVEGFTINWKKPMVAEGIIVAHTENSTDVYIDPEKFPHRIVDDWIEFDVGANEWYPLWRGDLPRYEPNYLSHRRDAADYFLPEKFVPLGDNIYRIPLKQGDHLENGDIVIIRHSDRIHAATFAEKCRDIVFEDITVHSCGGLGCLSQFCHNVTFKRVHFLPDREAGRLVSNGHDDGIHATSNSGTVTITECTFFGLMDDPVNVHGCCVTSDEAVNETTLRCKYQHWMSMGFRYWAEEGDEIAFIDRASMSRIATAKAVSYELEGRDDTFILTFDTPLPKEIIELANRGGALVLDNLTHTAAVVCTKNRFGTGRARGILASTPKPVLIADNYFESSGAGVLLAGDSNYWFESGECNDVEIRGNVFTDKCLTALYQFCDAIINICPIVPQPQIDKPFHKNIRVIDNIFDSADTPILYAYSCSGLKFENNRILRSHSANKWHPAKSLFTLRYCVDSSVKGNEWIGKFSDSVLTEENCERVSVEL